MITRSSRWGSHFKSRSAGLSRASTRFCRATRTISVLATLEQRGLVKTVTSPHLDKVVTESPISLYCGVDPTASSLHIGNLITLLPVLHFYLRGHNVFALVGGATGEAGDPAGRSTARDAMQSSILSRNIESLTAQIQGLFQSVSAYAATRGFAQAEAGTLTVVNNADFYQNLNYMDFMRTVGPHVRLSSMLARDSVKNRLNATGNAGLSYWEFSYQTMQAYDFWHLFKSNNVRLQIGGSDQYGNITTGIDLINRLQKQQTQESQEVFGLTVPLLTTPSGAKFGKSAGNAIWMDANMTSPFDLYQHFFKTPDSHLEQYLKLFTLLPTARIQELISKHMTAPGKRVANRELAKEVVTMIHNSDAYAKIDIANRILFPADFEDSSEKLDAIKVVALFTGDQALKTMPVTDVIGKPFTAVLRDCGVTQSAKQALQLIQNGGVRIGGQQLQNPQEVVEQRHLLDDRLLVLRVGKNKFTFIDVQA